MLKTYVYTALIAISIFYAQLSFAATPRLTVVVVVDGLRQDNLDLLRPYWQQGGLRLLSEEAYQTTVDFPHLVYGGNETTATLMTGVTPSQHGYAMDTYFSRSDRHVHPLLEDESQEGIGTNLKLSPRAIYTPTIGDQIRMRYGAGAKIFAVGIHPATTIVMAGHSANACCWLDAEKLNWVTTAYYPLGLPSAADEININGRITELAERDWLPRLSMTSYTTPSERELHKSFKYTNSDVLLQSPVANTLVVELALALQKAEKLGMDQTPDILLLQLNTVTPAATADRIQSAEQEDIHLCLNQDLGYLIEQLHRRIGKQNVDFLVVGRPVLGIGKETMQTAGIETNEFNVDRAAALVSTYLMALYGHERWVDGYTGSTIFFNRTLMEQKHLDLTAVQRQAANFLMEFEGVEMAYIPADIIVQPRLLASFNKRNMGDVVFTLEPFRYLAPTKTQGLYIDEEPTTSPLLYRPAGTKQYPVKILEATDINLLLEL